jgi:hypothetical protein
VPPASRARLLTSAIPAAISGAVVWWALATAHWSWWGISTMVPTNPESTSFGDLKAVLATSLCMRQGADYTTCDPYGRPFTPYVVIPARVLSYTGLDLTDTAWLGAVLASVYVATIAVLGLVLARAWRGRTPSLLGAQVLLGICAVTAPAMLGIERGQIEVVSLALTVAALILLTSAERRWRLLGALAGVGAVASKYFAIGLFAPFVRRGRPRWAALVALALSLLFLALSWSDLQQAMATSRTGEPATSQSQFGAMAMIATILSNAPITGIPSADVVAHWDTVRIASFVVVALAVGLATIAIPRTSLRSLDGIPVAYSLVVGCTGVLLIPYALGSSHDYRQVFLLPALAGTLVWLSASTGKAMLLPGLMSFAITLSMVTGASMILTPSGVPGPDEFIWPKAAITAGDIGLLFALATGAGIWIRGWMRRDA